jgi:hypothetical protein
MRIKNLAAEMLAAADALEKITQAATRARPMRSCSTENQSP